MGVVPLLFCNYTHTIQYYIRIIKPDGQRLKQNPKEMVSVLNLACLRLTCESARRARSHTVRIAHRPQTASAKQGRSLRDRTTPLRESDDVGSNLPMSAIDAFKADRGYRRGTRPAACARSVTPRTPVLPHASQTESQV